MSGNQPIPRFMTNLLRVECLLGPFDPQVPGYETVSGRVRREAGRMYDAIRSEDLRIARQLGKKYSVYLKEAWPRTERGTEAAAKRAIAQAWVSVQSSRPTCGCARKDCR